MTYKIRHWLGSEPMAIVETLDDARTFCRNHLLKAWHDRRTSYGYGRFLAELKLGQIQVFDARNTVYHSPGF